MQFGAGYPLELMTPYTLASTPNALVLTPSPPSATTTPPAATTTAGHPAPGVAQAADEGAAPARAGGHVKSAGMDVQLCLHVKTWQQLDAQGGLRI